MKKFIYYSTIVSIFTEALYYRMGFDIKLFYLIILFNITIFLAFNKVIYSRGLLIFHSIVIFTGLFSCIFGYNNFGGFFVQLFFLILIPIYYLSFFAFFEDKIEDIIFLYCKLCLLLAIIGFILLPMQIASGKSFQSLMNEPAHYCTVILPSFFITLKEQKFPRYYFIIILLSIIVSGSSLGYIGVALSLIMYAKKISISKILISSIAVTVVGIIVYVSFPPFKIRMDDTIKSSMNGDLSEANLSTYALLSNAFVSSKSFMSNPLIGNGIGSHVNSRNLYLNKIDGIEVFERMGMDQLNAQDAGSLFSRLMSELGLVGIVGVFYFIKKFYVASTGKELTFNAIVSRSILLYFFAKLFREGHYFSPEMYFFVFLYVFNKYERIKFKNQNLINAK